MIVHSGCVAKWGPSPNPFNFRCTLSPTPFTTNRPLGQELCGYIWFQLIPWLTFFHKAKITMLFDTAQKRARTEICTDKFSRGSLHKITLLYVTTKIN